MLLKLINKDFNNIIMSIIKIKSYIFNLIAILLIGFVFVTARSFNLREFAKN